MIGLIVRRMNVGAGVCVDGAVGSGTSVNKQHTIVGAGVGVGSGAIVNRQQKVVGAGAGVGSGATVKRQQVGSIVRRMSVGAGVGVGAIRQQTGSSVRSNRNVGSGVGVGDDTSFSVSVELVNTMRPEFGAGVALGSSFVA